jgi:hypothetical protein
VSAPEGVEGIRSALTAICEAFPEAEASSRTGQHSAFAVRGKKFAYYTVDHHGDGRLALHCKAPPGIQAELVATDPVRYFVPAYLGPRGWLGIDLEAPATDWDDVAARLRQAYLMTAPKRLAAALA